jgi:uncharacterized lipoprotein NlpE involved in copper resistance
MERYKFYIAGNKVIAVSTFAGKTVKGIAKCNPEDTFDIEKGKKLAAARCGKKIADKRLKRAAEKIYKADAEIAKAEIYYDKMYKYFTDAKIAREKAEYDLLKTLEDIIL